MILEMLCSKRKFSLLFSESDNHSACNIIRCREYAKVIGDHSQFNQRSPVRIFVDNTTTLNENDDVLMKRLNVIGSTVEGSWVDQEWNMCAWWQLKRSVRRQRQCCCDALFNLRSPRKMKYDDLIYSRQAVESTLGRHLAVKMEKAPLKRIGW
jgi:hypothetical protein